MRSQLLFFTIIVLLILNPLRLECQNSDSLGDDVDLDDEDEGSVDDNEFEDDDSSLDDAMFGRRVGGKKGNDHGSSPGSYRRDSDDSRQHVGITGMVPDVNPQYVFLPKDPEDNVNNCHEHAGSCTDPLYKPAMDHFCLGTCSKLGADGRDVAINCMPLADLCSLQSGPIAENLQKYCRGTCNQRSHISASQSQNQNPQQVQSPGMPPMDPNQFPDLPPEVEAVLPEETVETLKFIHKDTGLTFQQKQDAIDQVLVTLPNRVLDKIPTPPQWKKLPKSVRNKLKRIMRQRTKDFARKHVELQQYIQSLPPKQKAILAGPDGMGPATFL
ncbi:hypothetical protein DdX_02825 [Ditylenchus destructor]|uniref:Secreted protein n=1 Tax=Ditylenchus destructor TaxID=166010 RepID=A0AAD4NI42_9BILA|nr:hypothetical protein DdX_02825 [Ditylenchus destructor]